ncbi:MAG TPA: HNH endonuclease [Terriglobia bacterium]|nr:HNH endonuclease [Terriglobia bacterium]
METLQLDLLSGLKPKEAALFKKRSQQLISNLNARMRKKGFDGRIPLPQGRQVLAECVGRPCRYCGEKIKASTMSPDHPTPISKGGDPWVIEGICISCNHIKGELTAEEFTKFSLHLKTYSPSTERYIRGMMKGGAAYQRVLAISRSKFAQKRAMEQQVRDVGVEDFT